LLEGKKVIYSFIVVLAILNFRSSITLIQCVNNFLNWSGAGIPQALKAVTATPAAILGLTGVKGTLDSDADADLIVLDEEISENGTNLIVDQVWKFGAKVFDRSQDFE